MKDNQVRYEMIVLDRFSLLFAVIFRDDPLPSKKTHFRKEFSASDLLVAD
ncbi:MAG: hypothetical protein MPW14_25830 (plasmid) [Candidatus Manganitrophus sp.]|nr:MAG: hypothetical protein MPW14_25830 [Candidatus Manganitrophus sp.]